MVPLPDKSSMLSLAIITRYCDVLSLPASLITVNDTVYVPLYLLQWLRLVYTCVAFCVYARPPSPKSQIQLVGVPVLVSVKLIVVFTFAGFADIVKDATGPAGGSGDGLLDGDGELDGLLEGDSDGDGLLDGDSDGDADGDGLELGLVDGDALGLALGL